MKKVMLIAKDVVFKISAAFTLAGAFALSARAAFDANVDPIPVYGGSLVDLVGRVVNIVLYVAGLLAVIYLIYGGIIYITAGGEAEKATKGRTAITNAIIGIIIIAAALAIYNFVVRDSGIFS